ncbi:hypothetical protein F4703DRAFT_1818894 [Phycomyces blakesleeanus]
MMDNFQNNGSDTKVSEQTHNDTASSSVVDDFLSALFASKPAGINANQEASSGEQKSREFAPPVDMGAQQREPNIKPTPVAKQAGLKRDRLADEFEEYSILSKRQSANPSQTKQRTTSEKTRGHKPARGNRFQPNKRGAHQAQYQARQPPNMSHEGQPHNFDRQLSPVKRMDWEDPANSQAEISFNSQSNRGNYSQPARGGSTQSHRRIGTSNFQQGRPGPSSLPSQERSPVSVAGVPTYPSEGGIDRKTLTPETRMLIRRLPAHIKHREIVNHFSKYGEVLEFVPKKLHGFIQFSNPHSCAAAVRAESGKSFHGFVLGTCLFILSRFPPSPFFSPSSPPIPPLSFFWRECLGCVSLYGYSHELAYE